MQDESATRPQMDLLGCDRVRLEGIVISMGERPFRARQIYTWIYARQAAGFNAMSDLPQALRTRLAQEFFLGRPATRKVQESADGTRKYLFSLRAGGRVESVYIPESRRVTFCISSQIGCALDCRFCLTASLGFVRNLSAGEILAQVLDLREQNRAEIGDRSINIVMMGMGEALHNYENTMQALRIMMDTDGLAISARRITVSTAGMAPGIRKLAREPVRPRLAISLNATTDSIRSRLMPINRKFPLHELLDACRAFPLAPRERLTFEYVLLGGINDGDQDPLRLAALLRRHKLHAKVNLIPFNACANLPYQEPSSGTIQRFQRTLLALGVPTSIRQNHGRDILAACGQLALAS